MILPTAVKKKINVKSKKDSERSELVVSKNMSLLCEKLCPEERKGNCVFEFLKYKNNLVFIVPIKFKEIS